MQARRLRYVCYCSSVGAGFLSVALFKGWDRGEERETATQGSLRLFLSISNRFFGRIDFGIF